MNGCPGPRLLLAAGVDPVPPEAAFHWARDAARSALEVPVEGAEAAAWAVRGWAEVAAGCAALGSPAAFEGLDSVVRAAAPRRAGRYARRLRRLRRTMGPVPAFYPSPAPLRVHPRPRPEIADLCRALARFCDTIEQTASEHTAPEQTNSEQTNSEQTGPEQRASGQTAAGRTAAGRTASPDDPPRPPGRRPAAARLPWSERSAAAHLAWGERHRPTPCGAYHILDGLGRLPIGRAWMRLPLPGAPAVLLDAPRRTTPARRRIWQGIHEAAHLDLLAHTDDAEFGARLVAAESYVMAVELLATVSCLLAGEREPALCLRGGIVERMGRVPGYGDLGGPSPALREAARISAPEFEALPTLAEAYVAGPLAVLTGSAAAPGLPGAPAESLARRWAEACAAFPAARRLTDEARAVLDP